MGEVRTREKVWKSKPTIEGAGVHLKRAFGNAEAELFDPFFQTRLQFVCTTPCFLRIEPGVGFPCLFL